MRLNDWKRDAMEYQEVDRAILKKIDAEVAQEAEMQRRAKAYTKLVKLVSGAALVLEYGEQAQRKPMADHLNAFLQEIGEKA